VKWAQCNKTQSRQQVTAGLVKTNASLLPGLSYINCLENRISYGTGTHMIKREHGTTYFIQQAAHWLWTSAGRWSKSYWEECLREFSAGICLRYELSGGKGEFFWVQKFPGNCPGREY